MNNILFNKYLFSTTTQQLLRKVNIDEIFDKDYNFIVFRLEFIIILIVYFRSHQKLTIPILLH
jgi:hypothetical protein